jgi:hypothetical protein
MVSRQSGNCDLECQLAKNPDYTQNQCPAPVNECNRLISPVQEVRATLVAFYETDRASEAYRLGPPHAGRADILCILCCTEPLDVPARACVLCGGRVWALLYPDGVLGWAKTAHPALDVNDSSIWWMPRLIGAFFLFFVAVLALAFRGNWR